MEHQEDIQYHSKRAARELDLGLIAGNTHAARAHLRLASLHAQRVRDLGADKVKSLLAM